ncbi:MAG TPA: metallophosphoesterase [Candidatus Limnocylindria bacterium]|nr:metallophosphoesterase [Candidatus Limnocylindria bacterium]
MSGTLHHVGRNGTLRVAAAGDLHCTKESQGQLAPLFAEMAGVADVIALCGDLTDYGLPEEAHVLAAELRGVRAEIVAVLGNHDLESGRSADVVAILRDAGVRVLDGDAVEIGGVGFAGTKGFAGGFGARALGPWGEDAIKAFVQEAVDEVLKLEGALARLRTEQKVAVLHYAPVEATVVGEPEQIYAFLGSSRLEDPIDRLGATAVVHGHAHHGSPEGATRGGVPVYNVSIPLLRRTGARAFRVLELSADPVSSEQTN